MAHAPQPHPDSGERNQQETLLAGHLIGRLADKLTDRAGLAHPPPWQPRDHVLVGVLPAVPAPRPGTHGPVRAERKDSTRTAPECMPGSSGHVGAPHGALATATRSTSPAVSATQSSAPGAQRPVEAIRNTSAPPVLALDFRVRVSPGSTTVPLVISCGFALYFEDIATYDQHVSYLRGEGSEDSEEVLHQRASRTGEVLGVWRRHDVSVDGIAVAIPLNSGTGPGAGALGHAPDVPPTGPQATEPSQDLASGSRTGLTPAQGALDQAVGKAIEQHFARSEARRPLLPASGGKSGRRRRNTLPAAAMADEETFRSHLAQALDHEATPVAPRLVLTAHAQPLDGDDYLVRVSLHNTTPADESDWQDLSAYDCRLSVEPGQTARIVRQRFRLAPHDYRFADEAEVVGRGTGCAAVPHGGGLRSETLPVHAQQTLVPRDDQVRAPRWRELADNPTPLLDSVEVAMARYQRQFKAACREAEGLAHHDDIRADLAAFEDETRRFGLGRECLELDERLAQAFRLANEVFARVNEHRPYDSWRLFQLVYLVTHLPALAAREHRDRADLRAELDHTDVLWFPAGGGKTEAYLGLILTALFYDRLRGKHAGVSAWLRFPLRMLSVQQLDRTLRLLAVAETLRCEQRIGAADDDPFALGYLAGGDSTPNDLAYEKAWWRGWQAEAEAARAGSFADDHKSDRLVITCPFCDRDAVSLELDTERMRLMHRCTACAKALPLYVVDSDIYRTLPSVVVSTVDKLTGHSWFPEFTAFQHGPRYVCERHGYFSFPRQGGCPAGPDRCTVPPGGHPVARPLHDPVPALTVQDEMHLLKEELGAFNAHYEGLIAELQSGAGTGLPSKVLGASATIEQYQDQLRQLYGRKPRAFPSPGWQLGKSFYVTTTPDIRRIHLGVLPHRRHKTDVAAIVQAELIREVARLQEDPAPLTALLAAHGLPLSEDGVRALLFPYEVSLAYVNSKQHGAQLDEELGLLSDDMAATGFDRVQRVVLTGDVPVPELAASIARIQREGPSTPRGERLRALVGTSVLSHGVDLERLNLMVLAGMTPTVADYIQVTARAGRTHTGLVVTVHETRARRERSLFAHFHSHHRFLDRMVTPVPVNKYAFFAAQKTLPGVALALLHDAARRPEFGAPVEGIRRSKEFQRWWNTHRTAIEDMLERRITASYRERVTGVNGKGLEDDLVRRVTQRWHDEERPSLGRGAQDELTAFLFLERPLASFRDIDKASAFQPMNASLDAFKRLASAAGAEEERS